MRIINVSNFLKIKTYKRQNFEKMGLRSFSMDFRVRKVAKR